MIIILLALAFIIFTVIKIINYGRWAGKHGNRRGAIGLYLMALLCLVLPSAVFLLNLLR
ncbi:hypothetical protein [Desulfolucanica intricata]|uniref:hypothetical protein n=1 Tax=Desulfolucanica intricata TaxID=1285191 RepID=UPI000B11A30D|nr:hypothetical protein [Desulfolucanica intricata]